MSQPILTAEDVLAWNETTARNWRKLFTQHPELLNLPCDIAGTKTLAEVLQHIVAVQLRYAERIADLPITEYAGVPYNSVDTIYATHDRSIALFQQLLAADTDWDEAVEFPTRSARLRSTRKTILLHSLLHGIRHYAQLATIVRQHGVKPDWPMDYLFMHVERVE